MRVCGRSAIFLLVAFAALICHSGPSLAEARTLEGIVVHVADGDTITVLDSDKVQHRVRIAGIDAPEKGQPFGNASRKRLGELVARKEVRVEYHKYNRYGRIVGKDELIGRPPHPAFPIASPLDHLGTKTGKTTRPSPALLCEAMCWPIRLIAQLMEKFSRFP